MSINAYAAKRALFVILAAHPSLAGIQVAYAYPARDVERVCVYGGGIRFTQVDAAAEPGTIQDESTTLGVYVRVTDPALTVLETDTEAEAVGNVVAAVVAANPAFAGVNTTANVTSGLADYAQNVDEATSILSLQVVVDAFVDG